MNIDELAEEAITALITGAAGTAGGLVAQRLAASNTGTRALSELEADPAARGLANAVLQDELARDPSFANAVATALGTQTSALSIASGAMVRGDAVGGNLDKSKQYHIGSIRFGTTGLAAIVIASILAVGGAGYGIYETVTTGPGNAHAPEDVAHQYLEAYQRDDRVAINDMTCADLQKAGWRPFSGFAPEGRKVEVVSWKIRSSNVGAKHAEVRADITTISHLYPGQPEDTDITLEFVLEDNDWHLCGQSTNH